MDGATATAAAATSENIYNKVSIGIQVDKKNIKHNLLLPDEMYRRMSLIESSQNEYSHFLKKLQTVIHEITERYEDDNESTAKSASTASSASSLSLLNDELLPSTLNKDHDAMSLISNDGSAASLTNIIVNKNNYTELLRKSKRKINHYYNDDDKNNENIEKSIKKKCKNIQTVFLNIAANPEELIIGPNDTVVNILDYNSITWEPPSTATRKLLSLIFTNEILATHSLTGRPSPAFYGRERPLKNQLDPRKIADIIYAVTTRTMATEREVRAAITTKCADTSKMLKAKEKRQRFSI